MADDVLQRMAQQQQAMSQAMGGKPGFIGPFPLTWDATGGMKMESCGIGSKMIVQFGGTGKAGGMADKFLQAIQRSVDEVRQCGQQAGVMYSGDLPNGSLVGKANIAPSNSNGHEVG